MPELIGPEGNESPVLKPADARIPHPHMIAFEIDKLDPSLKKEADKREERYYERLYQDEQGRANERQRKLDNAEKHKTRIETERWQFVLTKVKATKEGTGLDGRGTKSPGFRYGAPSLERKRGMIKIPRKVEV